MDVEAYRWIATEAALSIFAKCRSMDAFGASKPPGPS
jgi:hypothetical protein